MDPCQSSPAEPSMAATAAAAGRLAQRSATAPGADAAGDGRGLSVTLLGTNGGPPPLDARFGISSAVVVDGRTYVVDCGRGAVSQYMRAGLRMPSLSGIFLTHLHADHTVDYFAFPLLAGGASGDRGFGGPVPVYGPGPAGRDSLVAGAPGPVPGTVEMTSLMSRAFASHSTFFLSENFGVDPATMVDVHDVLPPDDVAGSTSDPAPPMAPFTVMEDEHVRVSAVLVPHGAVYPSFAYRFDTDHGSVVFSGDTARTPNMARLADGADLLVHEAAALDVLPRLGLSSELLEHIREVHTDVADLGEVAVECNVGSLVVSHLSPGNPRAISDEGWRELISESARRAQFGGSVALGMDLMTLPISSR